jgi:hypothetical protein
LDYSKGFGQETSIREGLGVFHCFDLWFVTAFIKRSFIFSRFDNYLPLNCGLRADAKKIAQQGEPTRLLSFMKSATIADIGGLLDTSLGCLTPSLVRPVRPWPSSSV